ncbi:MAG TPA: hypothetical protein VFN13_11660 [Rudaea sp.]|nr:hypothetical protein [Rudaea sp.]
MKNPKSTNMPADPDKVPRHTTPTWEVELLISGVAVFAMLQLPGWLDDRFFALRPRFDQDWAGLILVLYVYLHSAAVMLALTFLLHLTLRALDCPGRIAFRVSGWRALATLEHGPGSARVQRAALGISRRRNRACG